MPINTFDYIQQHIQNIIEYFHSNKQTIKYSRKTSKLPLSFIKTTEEPTEKIFAISKTVLGKGINAVVKLGKDITTGELVAIKIQLFELSPKDLPDADNSLTRETQMLTKLKQFQGSTKKGSHYKFKFYIFSVFFEGIPYKNYFRRKQIPIIHTLEILLKILEQVKILHEQNIVHGDLSFNNILVHKKPDGEIEIHIVDYGLSGILKEGIRMFPVQEFEFSPNSYTPPECDYTRSPHLTTFNIGSDNYMNVHTWAKNGYGFDTASSDLYTLIWCVNYLNKKPDRILSYLFDKTCQQPHHIRPSLENITTVCQTYLENLKAFSHESPVPQEDPTMTPMLLLKSI